MKKFEPTHLVRLVIHEFDRSEGTLTIVGHGDDMRGSNVSWVDPRDLCKGTEKCLWCTTLLLRIQARVGRPETKKPKMSKEEAKLLIAHMRRLEKKASLGPWFQWTLGGDISSQPEDCIIMETSWTKKDKKGCTRATKQGEADIKFVIALRNNLGALLAALEERL